MSNDPLNHTKPHEKLLGVVERLRCRRGKDQSTMLVERETDGGPVWPQSGVLLSRAATDGKDQLRYAAGEDAKATYAMRLQIGDEAFRKAMDQQFFGK